MGAGQAIPLAIIGVTASNTFEMTPMYSTKEAAKRLGLSQNQVRYLLVKGEIGGKKLGHDWVVLSLDYQRKRKPKGGK